MFRGKRTLRTESRATPLDSRTSRPSPPATQRMWSDIRLANADAILHHAGAFRHQAAIRCGRYSRKGRGGDEGDVCAWSIGRGNIHSESKGFIRSAGTVWFPRTLRVGIDTSTPALPVWRGVRYRTGTDHRLLDQQTAAGYLLRGRGPGHHPNHRRATGNDKRFPVDSPCPRNYPFSGISSTNPLCGRTIMPGNM